MLIANPLFFILFLGKCAFALLFWLVTVSAKARRKRENCRPAGLELSQILGADCHMSVGLGGCIFPGTVWGGGAP